MVNLSTLYTKEIHHVALTIRDLDQHTGPPVVLTLQVDVDRRRLNDFNAGRGPEQLQIRPALLHELALLVDDDQVVRQTASCPGLTASPVRKKLTAPGEVSQVGNHLLAERVEAHTQDIRLPVTRPDRPVVLVSIEKEGSIVLFPTTATQDSDVPAREPLATQR